VHRSGPGAAARADQLLRTCRLAAGRLHSKPQEGSNCGDLASVRRYPADRIQAAGGIRLRLERGPCIPIQRRETLKISTRQSLAIQCWIADGVIQAAEELSDRYADGTRIDLRELGCCALAELGETEPRPPDDDLVAGVLLAFEGPLAGVALLAMEPEDALWWARGGAGDVDPVATYVELAGCVLGHVVDSVGASLGLASELGRPRLEENSLVGCLARTHAPSDTVVLSSRLRLEAGGRHCEAWLYLLMAPKRLASLAGAMGVAEA
jgi:hypothetical protein